MLYEKAESRPRKPRVRVTGCSLRLDGTAGDPL